MLCKLNELIKSDLFRYAGNKKLSSYFKLIIKEPSFRYIVAMRKASGKNNIFMYNLYRFKYKCLQRKYLLQIPAETTIGEGFYVGHYGSIVINPKVIMGKNVNISTGVTIGQENRGKRKGTPIIGDKVWIGTNAVIVGKIIIGNNVLIAPNAFVNFDVPDNSVVIGNPAKIIHKDNATEGYINNCV